MANVTIVSPQGNPEVWPEEKAAQKLQHGYKAFDTWKAEQKSIAQQKHQEWLTSPDTVEERFQMLRQVCESRLAQTDYAMNIDYPITEASKTALLAYRKAIRELNHQTGAPWDGGGSLTPWPVMPNIVKSN